MGLIEVVNEGHRKVVVSRHCWPISIFTIRWTCGLTDDFALALEKTKVLEFGPLARIHAEHKGEKAETFDFLGFTHYCSRARNGRLRFRMKRKTISKRFAAKAKGVKEWLKSNRTLPTAELMKKLAAKLNGHYAYYGVTDNSRGISSFYFVVCRLLHEWLNRRGKRRCCNWAKFNLLLQRFPLPIPRLKVSLF